MRKFGTISIVVCLCSVAVLARTDDCLGDGQIEGKVLDSNSRPVIGAKVSVLSEECVVTGIAPMAVTDDHGHFLLSGVPVGVNGVFAQKPEVGYPDTTGAIYLDDSAPPPKVVVRAGVVVPGVVVRLGKKAGLHSGEIMDAESLQPLLSARIRISLPEKDKIMLSMGPDSTGRFHLLLPARPVRLTINAPGYVAWQYDGDQTSPGIIQLESGAKTELKVKLRKSIN